MPNQPEQFVLPDYAEDGLDNRLIRGASLLNRKYESPLDAEQKYAESGTVRADGLRVGGVNAAVNESLATDVQDRAEAAFKKGTLIGAKDDGMTETTSTGTITRSFLSTTLSLSATGGLATLNGDLGDISLGTLGRFACSMRVGQATATQNIFLGFGSFAGDIPNDAVSTVYHVGFFVDDATLYASNADGVTQTTTAITGFTLTDYNTYNVKWTEMAVEFRINDTLVASHYANIPLFLNLQEITIGIDSGGVANSKSITIYNNYLTLINL